MQDLYNKILDASQFNTIFYSKIYILDLKSNLCYNIKTNETILPSLFLKSHPIKKQLNKNKITQYKNYIIINTSSYKDFYIIKIIEQEITHLKKELNELPINNSITLQNKIQNLQLKNYQITFITFHHQPTINIESFNTQIYKLINKAYEQSLHTLYHPTYNEYYIISDTLIDIQTTIKKFLILYRKSPTFHCIPNIYITKHPQNILWDHFEKRCHNIKPKPEITIQSIYQK